jgi:hypothetical protein
MNGFGLRLLIMVPTDVRRTRASFTHKRSRPELRPRARPPQVPVLANWSFDAALTSIRSGRGFLLRAPYAVKASQRAPLATKNFLRSVNTLERCQVELRINGSDHGKDSDSEQQAEKHNFCSLVTE